MATRSATIVKAQGLIPQASVDNYWSYDEWNDYYHQMLDMVHAAVVDANLPYYLVLGATLTKDSNDLYPLPANFFQLLWLEDDNGEQLYELKKTEDKIDEREGFTFYNGFIKLVNVDTLPATLTIDYRKLPTYIGDWAGGTDADTDAYKPEAPLNDDRGHRLLAYGIAALAAAKDASVQAAQMQIAKSLVDNFVDRLRAFNRSEPKIIGT